MATKAELEIEVENLKKTINELKRSGTPDSSDASTGSVVNADLVTEVNRLSKENSELRTKRDSLEKDLKEARLQLVAETDMPERQGVQTTAKEVWQEFRSGGMAGDQKLLIMK